MTGFPQNDRWKLVASAWSGIIQQMCQGITSLGATCWVLAYLCGGVGSQGVVSVKPAEFISP